MLDWKSIVQDYIIKHSNLIRKTTQPLRDHFGIGYFTYHRIDSSGKYTVLVDRPDWAEHYVSEKIFLIDPYLRDFNNYQSGMCLFGNHGSDEYKDRVMRSGKEVLGMDMAVMLINKEADSAEFFGFSGNHGDSCLESLYLSQPNILKSFAKHFKGQLNSILLDMETEASSLVDLKGKDFFNKQLIKPDLDPSLLTAFLSDIGMQQDIDRAFKLTARERECLKLLIQHHSYKDIAAMLGLSHRTVEFYIDNIKNKFTCWNKQEVIELAKHFAHLGLL